MTTLVLILILLITITGCANIFSYKYGRDYTFHRHDDSNRSYVTDYRACVKHAREFRKSNKCKFCFLRCLQINEGIITICLYKKGWER